MNALDAWGLLKEIGTGIVWVLVAVAAYLWRRFDTVLEEQIRHDEQIKRLVSDAESEKDTRRRENARQNEQLGNIQGQLTAVASQLATLIGEMKTRGRRYDDN